MLKIIGKFEEQKSFKNYPKQMILKFNTNIGELELLVSESAYFDNFITDTQPQKNSVWELQLWETLIPQLGRMMFTLSSAQPLNKKFGQSIEPEAEAEVVEPDNLTEKNTETNESTTATSESASETVKPANQKSTDDNKSETLSQPVDTRNHSSVNNTKNQKASNDEAVNLDPIHKQTDPVPSKDIVDYDPVKYLDDVKDDDNVVVTESNSTTGSSDFDFSTKEKKLEKPEDQAEDLGDADQVAKNYDQAESEETAKEQRQKATADMTDFTKTSKDTLFS